MFDKTIADAVRNVGLDVIICKNQIRAKDAGILKPAKTKKNIADAG